MSLVTAQEKLKSWVLHLLMSRSPHPHPMGMLDAKTDRDFQLKMAD